MPGTNQFLPFAVGAGANTLTPTAYAALASLLANGFVSGVANSAQFNTALRQATTAAAGLAQFIADQGPNVNDDGSPSNFASSLLTALQAANPSASPGEIRGFARGTIPAGRWLKANGSAVLVTSYSALASAIYCGDAKNATADWGYRATSNTSPSSNRSTTGAYIVLPDYRGRFLRGWADDGSIDSARDLWKYQDHAMQDHVHGGGMPASGAPGIPGGNGSSPYNAGNTYGVVGANVAAENRPVNSAALICIAY